MIGSQYDDTYVVDNVGDIVDESSPRTFRGTIFSSGSGTDTVKASISYTLTAGVENLVLTGTHAITGTGNELENTLDGSGNTAVNVLAGGQGNDTYQVDAGDVVVENAGEGSRDTVVIKYGPVGTYSLSMFPNVENLHLALWVQDSNLVGDAGNNWLQGNLFSNVLTGGAGDDVLQDQDPTLSGGSADILDGGAGNDRLHVYGDDGGSTIVFGRGYGNDSLYGGSSLRDRVLFNAGVEIGDLQVERNGRDLLLSVGQGDVLTVVNHFVDETSTSDYRGFGYVEFADGATLDQQALLTRLASGSANTATASADALFGSSAADTFAGLDGDDVLLGAAGDDTLSGNAGGDTLQGGAGDDTYTFARGDGQDVLIDLSGAQDTIQLADGIAVTDVVVKRPSNADLRIFVGDSGDQITVRGFYTGSEIEKLSFADGTVWNAATLKDKAATVYGTSANDSSVSGDPWDNLIFGLEGNDSLWGGDGDDVLDGGSGVDTMNGGLGNDVYYVDDIGDVVYGEGGSGSDIVYSSVSRTLEAYVEALTLLENGALNATGNTLSNVLTGNSAANVLNGGTGADTLIGWAGNDTYIVDNAGDVVVEQSGGGVDLVQATVSHTLSANVENLTLIGSGGVSGTGNALDNTITGNSGANTLTGGDGNDTLDGGTGADTLVGGTGNDTYLVERTTDVMTESANEGIDAVMSSVAWTLGANVENLTLTGTASVAGTGNTLANVLTGNSGANRLDGGAGADTMAGGSGNDTYVVGDAGDIVTELASAGTDTIEASLSWTLASDVENLVLTGTSAINGTGNALDNVLTGNSAANVLTGGAGNDTYVVGAGDTVVEAASAGTDTVQASVSWTLASNVENLVLTGGSAINGTGNAINNRLTGNSAANMLTGGAGNDTYIVGAGDTVVEAAGGGTDTVESTISWTLGSNIEYLTLRGTAAINGTGNSLNNVFRGNSAANVFTGGAGNDIYVVGAGDTVVEAASAGTDYIQADVSWTLGDNLENLELKGTGATHGAGNALNNTLTGNSASNVLTGNAGNDTLDGAGGADTLLGGTGADVYRFGVGYGVDTVQENDATTGVKDAIAFAGTVNQADVQFRRVGNNLEMSMRSTSDKLVVQNWYLGGQYHVEEFRFANGTLLDTQVQSLAAATTVSAASASGVRSASMLDSTDTGTSSTMVEVAGPRQSSTSRILEAFRRTRSGEMKGSSSRMRWGGAAEPRAMGSTELSIEATALGRHVLADPASPAALVSAMATFDVSPVLGSAAPSPTVHNHMVSGGLVSPSTL